MVSLHGSLISKNRSSSVQAHSLFREPTTSAVPSFRNLYGQHHREWLSSSTRLPMHNGLPTCDPSVTIYQHEWYTMVSDCWVVVKHEFAEEEVMIGAQFDQAN
ncbi:hypothetical protein MKW92_003404 [Papaver armeniacum]|nr:hypothetical protein MKW92_003404 [Papaver armeniacum]